MQTTFYFLSLNHTTQKNSNRYINSLLVILQSKWVLINVANKGDPCLDSASSSSSSSVLQQQQYLIVTQLQLYNLRSFRTADGKGVDAFISGLVQSDTMADFFENEAEESDMSSDEELSGSDIDAEVRPKKKKKEKKKKVRARIEDDDDDEEEEEEEGKNAESECNHV